MFVNVNLKQVLTYLKNDIQLEWDGNDKRRMECYMYHEASPLHDTKVLTFEAQLHMLLQRNTTNIR
jgi:hypothetical protein